MSFRRAIFDAEIWQIVRIIGPALLQMGRIPIDCIYIKNGRNRWKDRSLEPCGWLAVGAQSRFHIHGRYSVIIVKLDIVFPCPNHLHRPAHFFGQNRGLRHVIGLRLAPESPTEKRDVANHIFFRDPELFRNDVLHSLRILRRSP